MIALLGLVVSPRVCRNPRGPHFILGLAVVCGDKWEGLVRPRVPRAASHERPRISAIAVAWTWARVIESDMGHCGRETSSIGDTQASMHELVPFG